MTPDLRGPLGTASPRPHGGRLSTILQAMADDTGRERISVGDLLGAISYRAYGGLMFVFAAPNMLPTPPGTSVLLGTPLLFLAFQLIIRRPVPWLPAVIAQRSMPHGHFAAIMQRALPWLIRAETLLRPRLSFLAYPPFEQVIALACFLLAVILFLPIPLGNMPPAVAICLFSLALLERDGIAVILAAAVTSGSILLVWGVIKALVVSAIYVIVHMTGLSLTWGG